jgi:hypothetical protein
MKIRPVGAELFHADGRTDRTKLIVAFGNSAKAPNKLSAFIEQSSEMLCHVEWEIVTDVSGGEYVSIFRVKKLWPAYVMSLDVD